MSIEQKLNEKLRQRESEGSLRKLTVTDSTRVDFCSNDYLGLSRNTQLHQQIQHAYEQILPLQNGATGSRLISGNYLFYSRLEESLTRLFQADSILVFNSGYAANTAILSAVPQRGDTIIYDEYIHASLKEGARLSFASRFSFRHNNLEDLEKKLQRATGDCFVVAESVYSMDGDFAPLTDILLLCEKYGAYLIWDEAHSTGVWGTGGNGMACAARLHSRIFARVYTFGKGPGVHGACIAGSSTLVNYLINFARPFIYTTALPLHALVSIEQTFVFQKNNPELQTRLHQKIHYFRQCLNAYPELKSLTIPSQSPIQAVTIGGNERTRYIATQLQAMGFDVRPILSPTVKQGEERLRVCLHVYNTEVEIASLLQATQQLITNPALRSNGTGEKRQVADR